MAARLDLHVRNSLRLAGPDAMRAEELDCGGVWNAETNGDPFAGLALMAEHTSRITVGSAIAVAFARSPMTTAYSAHQLQDYSGGRLLLGLGSQIKPHIERRFDMPWSRPIPRMRDYVGALRAIWTAWETGEPLAYEGEFYRHTLMPEMFRPPAHGHRLPPVFLAAVGPAMLHAAGEIADGVFAHSFTTEQYLRDVVLPTIHTGQTAAGRPDGSVAVAVSAFVATDEADLASVRKQISFYGSTTAYRPVLEMHGLGELQTELHALSRQDRWDDMAGIVPDELLDLMCVSGTPEQIAAALHVRYDDIADRIGLNIPGEIGDPARYAAVIGAYAA